eukprot:5121-Hanusia_phi.AAC.1
MIRRSDDPGRTGPDPPRDGPCSRRRRTVRLLRRSCYVAPEPCDGRPGLSPRPTQYGMRIRWHRIIRRMRHLSAAQPRDRVT